MTTSSSKNFELDVAEYIEEAFERCGLELRTAYDLKTAKRSLNLLLAEWANRGLNQWTISQTAIALTQGTTSYSLDATNPTAVIDVLDAFIRRTTNGTASDLQMNQISNLSLKKAPERTGMLKQLYEEEFQRALSQDEDRASFRATPDLRSYNYA
jgi:hypothetical protein